MILIVNQVINIKAVTPGSNEDLFPGKDSANGNGSKAIVSIRINPINGDPIPEIGTEVIIIGLEPIKARVVKRKSSFFSGNTIDLFIDKRFENDLEQGINKIIYNGGGIFALSDKYEINTWTEQKDFYQSLAHFILSDSISPLLEIGKKAFILDPRPNTGYSHIHLSGHMTYNKDHRPPCAVDDQPLHHVATLSCKESTEALSEYSNCHLLDHLSFYIDSLHTDQGWPVNAQQYSVQNYQEAINGKGVHPEDQGTELTMRPFYSIPGPDHSIILSYGLNKEDRFRYGALFNTYHKVIGIGKKRRIQFLGYPQDGLNCVAFEAESLYHRKSFSSIHYMDASKWQLLLQISPQLYQFPFFNTFGDASIYFLIRNQDLNDGNFSKIQVVVQNL